MTAFGQERTLKPQHCAPRATATLTGTGTGTGTGGRASRLDRSAAARELVRLLTLTWGFPAAEIDSPTMTEAREDSEMQAVFAAWRTEILCHSDHFVEDGVISQEHWETAKRKVLFVLKGTNDLRRSISETVLKAATVRPKSAAWDRPTFHNVGRRGRHTLVRVPDQTPGFIMRAPDAGAMGVVVPNIASAAQARAAVSAAKYKEGRNGGGRRKTRERNVDTVAVLLASDPAALREEVAFWKSVGATIFWVAGDRRLFTIAAATADGASQRNFVS